jgi:hypothetical protein
MMMVAVLVWLVSPHGGGDGGGHGGGIVGGSGGSKVVWSRSGGLPLRDALWHNKQEAGTKGDELEYRVVGVVMRKGGRARKETKTT